MLYLFSFSSTYQQFKISCFITEQLFFTLIFIWLIFYFVSRYKFLFRPFNLCAIYSDLDYKTYCYYRINIQFFFILIYINCVIWKQFISVLNIYEKYFFSFYGYCDVFKMCIQTIIVIHFCLNCIEFFYEIKSCLRISRYNYNKRLL